MKKNLKVRMFEFGLVFFMAMFACTVDNISSPRFGVPVIFGVLALVSFVGYKRGEEGK